MRIALFWVIALREVVIFLKKLTTICCVITQKSAALRYFPAEAYNHAATNITQITAYWDFRPCSSVNRFVRNVHKYWPYYTRSHYRRMYFPVQILLQTSQQQISLHHSYRCTCCQSNTTIFCYSTYWGFFKQVSVNVSILNSTLFQISTKFLLFYKVVQIWPRLICV